MISARPAWPDTGTTTVPADLSWAEQAWVQIAGNGLTAITATLTAAVLGGLAVYLLMRRPGRPDISKHLMYVPLLLVNAAAIYGQVAFFYEQVAPDTWPVPGKLALSALIAAAVESIAVYVGWHAHDALLNKAGATAARLRRASYLIALLVGGINYAHFADPDDLPTGAAVTFGLLSLLSPWLWGLHTRRAQHVQLTNEGVVDATGATFSMERIRSFPIRAYMARRWSIDHYVTDPRRAWEGYNADLSARRASTRASRVRSAWLVLTGRADITPGVTPAVWVGSRVGAGTDTHPVAEPGPPVDTAQDITAGRLADIPTGGLAGALNGVVRGLPSGRAAHPRAARTSARKRASDPGGIRVQQPTSAQLKAFKLREQNPGITWAQLAAKVGKNERTVRRWFEAARPPAEPEERAPMPTPASAFDPPKTPVLAGVNGRPYKPEEN